MRPANAASAFVTAFFLSPVMSHADDHGHKHHDHKYDGHRHGEAAHVAESDELHVMHAWAASEGSGDTPVYMRIHNKTDQAITLKGAEGNWAAEFFVTGTMLNDGSPERIKIEALSIPPGAAMILKPDGAAILAHGLLAGLSDGDIRNLHLQFDDKELEVEVQILPHGATRHPHAGHMH